LGVAANNEDGAIPEAAIPAAPKAVSSKNSLLVHDLPLLFIVSPPFKVIKI
jgi:hypothetical protein